MKPKIPEGLKKKLKGRKIKVAFVVGIILVASYLYFARPQFNEGVYGDYIVALPVMTDVTVINLQAGENFGGQTMVSVGSLRLSIELVMISFLFFDWQRPTFAENTTIHSIDLWYLQEDVLGLERRGGDLSMVCPVYLPIDESSMTYAGRIRVPSDALQYCSPFVPLDLSMAWFSWNMTRMMTEAFGGRVTTLPTMTFDNTSANLFGELISLGGRSNVTVYFQWGLGNTLNLMNQKTAPQIMDDFGGFNATLINLTPDTTYYYHTVIESEGQMYRGNLEEFTTPLLYSGPVPIVPLPPPPECIFIPGIPEECEVDPNPDSIDNEGSNLGPGNPLRGAVMLSFSGNHIFSSEDHNRPERRPYVTYSYTGPRILSPAEAGQVYVWSFMAIVAAPLALMVLILGRRYGKALMYHYKQNYDHDGARWLFRVNQWQYDARDFGVFGKDETDEDHKQEGK